MKLRIKERYDSPHLMKLFKQLKSKGYCPIWVDPYNQFAVNTEKGVYLYSQMGNGKLTKTLYDGEMK
jgi:hypothetical protein